MSLPPLVLTDEVDSIGARFPGRLLERLRAMFDPPTALSFVVASRHDLDLIPKDGQCLSNAPFEISQGHPLLVQVFGRELVQALNDERCTKARVADVLAIADNVKSRWPTPAVGGTRR